MEKVLKVNNIYKTYGKTDVLKGVSFTVHKGITALIGINGAGKSTLINIICGIVKPTSGNVIFYENNFGYMPQKPSLFNELTVYENLLYFANIYKIEKNQIENVLDTCKLVKFKNTYFKNLSGGYKQLCSLAVAILHDPGFIILDEPTSAMDPIFKDYFWEIICKLKSNNKTILCITHSLEELSICDNLLVLENGIIIYDGKIKKHITIEEFKKLIQGDDKWKTLIVVFSLCC